MTEGLWSLTIFVAGGLSFIAYYHPRQYAIFATLLGICLVGLLGYGCTAVHFQKKHVEWIQKSEMQDDQKELAIRVIEGDKEGPLPPKALATILLVVYAFALTGLPEFGLTAQQRDPPRRR